MLAFRPCGTCLVGGGSARASQLCKPGKSVGEHHYSSEPTVGSVCSNSTNNHEQVLGRFRKSKNLINLI